MQAAFPKANELLKQQDWQSHIHNTWILNPAGLSRRLRTQTRLKTENGKSKPQTMGATTSATKGLRCGVPEKQERLEAESYM